MSWGKFAQMADYALVTQRFFRAGGNMEDCMGEKQVKSKQRVADHGEVFTAQREVNAMLDMVKNETERIESRFLEIIIPSLIQGMGKIKKCALAV